MITSPALGYQKPLLRRIIVTSEAPHGTEPLPDALLAGLHRAAFAECCEAGDHGGAAAAYSRPGYGRGSVELRVEAAQLASSPVPAAFSNWRFSAAS